MSILSNCFYQQKRYKIFPAYSEKKYKAIITKPSTYWFVHLLRNEAKHTCFACYHSIQMNYDLHKNNKQSAGSALKSISFSSPDKPRAGIAGSRVAGLRDPGRYQVINLARPPYVGTSHPLCLREVYC